MSLMRAAALANFVDVARQLGLNPDQQLRAVGLNAQMIRTPDRLISSDAVVRLLENVAAITDCDTVGLRMSEPRSMSQFGIVGLLLAQQRTMREALRMALRYLPLINESLAVQLEEHGATALLREEVLTDGALSSHQSTELAMVANVKIFRALLGPHWHPRRVYFRHAAPRSLALHQQTFRCPCEFLSDFNAMAFPAADLDIPNPSADLQMASYALGFIETLGNPEGMSVTTDVRRSIYLLLPLGRASIKQVAQSLGCSVRKLQLDLAKAGTSFGDLLDEARGERVQVYLENPWFEMGQVAALLGYSHQSAFTRWFSRRFGMSPSMWRHSSTR